MSRLSDYVLKSKQNLYIILMENCYDIQRERHPEKYKDRDAYNIPDIGAGRWNRFATSNRTPFHEKNVDVICEGVISLVNEYNTKMQ